MDGHRRVRCLVDPEGSHRPFTPSMGWGAVTGDSPISERWVRAEAHILASSSISQSLGAGLDLEAHPSCHLVEPMREHLRSHHVARLVFSE